MPEQIAMTPPDINGNQVIWNAHTTERGVFYVPEGSLVTELGKIGSGEIKIEQLEVIGRGGADKKFPATVYRTPCGNALRVVSSQDVSGQGGLEWLRANIALKSALDISGELDLFHQKLIDFIFKKGVITPTYLGYLSSDLLGSIYLMSDESRGREVLSANNERYCDMFGAYSFAREAIQKNYGKMSVGLDHTPSNFLLGDDDIVILDAMPGQDLL